MVALYPETYMSRGVMCAQNDVRAIIDLAMDKKTNILVGQFSSGI